MSVTNLDLGIKEAKYPLQSVKSVQKVFKSLKAQELLNVVKAAVLKTKFHNIYLPTAPSKVEIQ